MKYNNDWVRRQVTSGRVPEFLFFWGHRPLRNGQIGKSCFSQWFERPFVHAGIHYPTAEHWMMAEKARLFGDEENLANILASTSPGAAKSYGRQVNNFSEAEWCRHRERIVIEGNLHKFGQHPDLQRFLLATWGKILVEASPQDRIWGIGRSAEEPGIADPDQWRGLNLLGYALMEVRDMLALDQL